MSHVGHVRWWCRGVDLKGVPPIELGKRGGGREGGFKYVDFFCIQTREDVYRKRKIMSSLGDSRENPHVVTNFELSRVKAYGRPGAKWMVWTRTYPSTHTHVHFHLNMFIRTDDDVGAVSGAKLVLLSLDALWVWQNKNTSNEYLNSLYLLQNIWFKVRETTLTCTFVLKTWMSGSWPLVFGLLLLRIIDSWASSGESHHAG